MTSPVKRARDPARASEGDRDGELAEARKGLEEAALGYADAVIRNLHRSDRARPKRATDRLTVAAMFYAVMYEGRGPARKVARSRGGRRGRS